MMRFEKAVMAAVGAQLAMANDGITVNENSGEINISFTDYSITATADGEDDSQELFFKYSLDALKKIKDEQGEEAYDAVVTDLKDGFKDNKTCYLTKQEPSSWTTNLPQFCNSEKANE